MEKRKFLRLRLKIRLSCSDLHYIFHILNSIGGPLGPMVQTSPSAQSDRSRTIKKIIKPVWTNGPLDRSGPVVLSLGADHRAPCFVVGHQLGRESERLQQSLVLRGIVVWSSTGAHSAPILPQEAFPCLCLQHLHQTVDNRIRRAPGRQRFHHRFDDGTCLYDHWKTHEISVEPCLEVLKYGYSQTRNESFRE